MEALGGVPLTEAERMARQTLQEMFEFLLGAPSLQRHRRRLRNLLMFLEERVKDGATVEQRATLRTLLVRIRAFCETHRDVWSDKLHSIHRLPHNATLRLDASAGFNVELGNMIRALPPPDRPKVVQFLMYLDGLSGHAPTLTQLQEEAGRTRTAENEMLDSLIASMQAADINLSAAADMPEADAMAAAELQSELGQGANNTTDVLANLAAAMAGVSQKELSQCIRGNGAPSSTNNSMDQMAKMFNLPPNLAAQLGPIWNKVQETTAGDNDGDNDTNTMEGADDPTSLTYHLLKAQKEFSTGFDSGALHPARVCAAIGARMQELSNSMSAMQNSNKEFLASPLAGQIELPLPVNTTTTTTTTITSKTR